MLIRTGVGGYIYIYTLRFPTLSRRNTLGTGYTWTTSSWNMVKNFSVDWLAQSYHDYKQDQEPVETSQALVKRHVPCLVQPRPPTSYDKVYIQPKLKCSRIEENTSAEEQKEKEGIVFKHSAQRSCTSPSCKYLHYLLYCVSNWKRILRCKSITRCAFVLFSFREERLLFRLWKRGRCLRVSLHWRRKWGGERWRRPAQSQNQIHSRANWEVGENLQQTQIPGCEWEG